MSRINASFGKTLLAVIIAATGSASHDGDRLAQVTRKAWQAGRDTIEITLWPQGAAIDRFRREAPEWFSTSYDLIGGRPVEIVRDVSRPTLTLYPAKGANSGAAVMVIPGGGYRALAIDLEGTEVCDWLTSKGITCALLKYRVPGSRWIALQDAQRAIGVLRRRAEEFHFDRQKLGILGFSTSGQLVAALSARARRSYAPLDAADADCTQPDFAIALSPDNLRVGLGDDPPLKIEAGTSPTLILQGEMDPIDESVGSLAYYLTLKRANVPVRMQFYAGSDGEAALRSRAAPAGGWPFALEAWLHAIGMLKSSADIDRSEPAPPPAGKGFRSVGQP